MSVSKAHFPDPAHEVISSGPPHFAEIKSKLNLLRKKVIKIFIKIDVVVDPCITNIVLFN